VPPSFSITACGWEIAGPAAGATAPKLAQFLHSLLVGSRWRGIAFASNRIQATGVWMPDSRANIMQQDNGTFGIIVGGLVALAAVIFIFSGGELGGKKTIESDDDLPPIASADRN